MVSKAREELSAAGRRVKTVERKLKAVEREDRREVILRTFPELRLATTSAESTELTRQEARKELLSTEPFELFLRNSVVTKKKPS